MEVAAGGISDWDQVGDQEILPEEMGTAGPGIGPGAQPAGPEGPAVSPRAKLQSS